MKCQNIEARRFWIWWLRWMHRGFDRAEAGYLAWQMRHPPTDWLGEAYGYEAYCHYYAGGHSMPLRGYLKPRYNPDTPYYQWRKGPPMPLP